MAFGSNKDLQMAGPLQGWKLLTTRPEPLAARLLEPLHAAGAQAKNIPLLELQPLELLPEQRQWLLDLDLFHKVVVISPSAARFFLDALDEFWPQWPVGLDWFTVGAGTAKTLQAAGIEASFPSQGDKSEDLLTLPALQHLHEQKLLLVKGQGGRTLLEETLVSRGAQVKALELYQRLRPRLNHQQLAELNTGDYDAIVITSGEALQQYIEFTQGTPKKRLLLLPSHRLEIQAREAGFVDLINTGGAGADAILKSLLERQPGHP